jgi:hypothetical protein
MAGKWSYLRDKYPKMPVDANYQQKIDAVLDDDSEENQVVKAYGLPLRKLSDEDFKNEYLKRRDELDDLAARQKVLNLEIEAMTRLTVERFENDGTSSVTYDDGVSLGHSVEPYPFVDDQAALLAWVKRNGMEAMLTLNYQTMASLVKERLEGKVNEPLPDGVNVYMKDKLSCRGRKNKPEANRA